MKRIGSTAALALLFSLPLAGWAEASQLAAATEQPAAKPAAVKKQESAAKPEAAKPQVAVVQAAAVKAAPDRPKHSRANEDARACLEFATNIEIHKCAEKYR